MNVEPLLDELCAKLGFCLKPADRETLSASPPSDVDAFTDAVLEAEGMHPSSQFRLQVRERVAHYFARERRRVEGDIMALLDQGRKLDAIASYRQSTGVALAQARLAVDNVERGLPVDTPPPAPWRSPPIDQSRQAELATRLPQAWTLARLRALLPGVALLEPGSHQVELIVGKDRLRLDVELILDFGGLCLVRARNEEGWCMGQIDSDGSITCWGDYGSDLEKAIEAL